LNGNFKGFTWIISELLHNWAVKSQKFGFSLMPVPSDPFALPITLNSDPVRGPIFIELDTDCLLDDTNLSNIFEKFPEKSREQRLFLFREEIAHRFGFINSATDRSQKQSSSAMFSTDHQYVHCTGNMFLLIPTQLQLQTGIQGIKSRQSIAGMESGSLMRNKRKETLDTNETSEGEGGGQTQMRSLTRHLSQAKPTYDHSETGFLWSWNFMISKKWKITSNTGATGEIPFMDKMLADFRAFCKNDCNRLTEFWKECNTKYQKQQINANQEKLHLENLSQKLAVETNAMNLSDP
jgi:hypothetical protein